MDFAVDALYDRGFSDSNGHPEPKSLRYQYSRVEDAVARFNRESRDPGIVRVKLLSRRSPSSGFSVYAVADGPSSLDAETVSAAFRGRDFIQMTLEVRYAN